MKKIAFSILSCIYSIIIFGQDTIVQKKVSPPIPVEVMAGNNRLFYQLIINKRFSDQSRLGFFSVSSFETSYKNDKALNEFMTPVLINCQIIKGLALTAGAAVNSSWGFRPYAGLQYIFANPIVLVVIAPGIYLTESHNIETLVLLEYKTKLAGNWSLYTRLQCLYTQTWKLIRMIEVMFMGVAV